MQQFIGKSKNKVTVTYDPVNSHAATHIKDASQLKDLVAEAIANMELSGQEVATHVDMGRPVGVCDVVHVDETDEIVYASEKIVKMTDSFHLLKLAAANLVLMSRCI